MIHNKLEIEIEQDEVWDGPRDWDNVGKMICSHRSYTLGDDQFNSDDYEGWDDLKSHLVKDEKAVIVLPLFLYDHSGISMYTLGDTRYRQHEAWDSGQVGFIYCTQEDINYYFSGNPEAAKKCLESEVEVYDQWLRGDVYYYEVTNPRNGEVVDPCHGLYGYDYAVEEAKRVADAFVHPHEAAYAKNAVIRRG